MKSINSQSTTTTKEPDLPLFAGLAETTGLFYLLINLYVTLCSVRIKKAENYSIKAENVYSYDVNYLAWI